MPRVARRAAEAVSELQQAVHQYLHYRKVAADAKKHIDNKKGEDYKVVAEYVQENGELDESTGSLFWDLDEPLKIGGKTVTGFRWQKSQGGKYIDADLAQKLATEKDVVERMTHKEVVWDYDELYVLHQQGLITEEELDAVLVDPQPTWSLRVQEY